MNYWQLPHILLVIFRHVNMHRNTEVLALRTLLSMFSSRLVLGDGVFRILGGSELNLLSPSFSCSCLIAGCLAAPGCKNVEHKSDGSLPNFSGCSWDVLTIDFGRAGLNLGKTGGGTRPFPPPVPWAGDEERGCLSSDDSIAWSSPVFRLLLLNFGETGGKA